MIIADGDLVLISASADKKWMVKIEKEKEFHTHRGSIPLKNLIGLEYGSSFTNAKGATFYLWKPIPYDFLEAITHSTQVIYQTDIAQILFSAGICSGVKVIEAGTGSGGLTAALARYVLPMGKVYSYDIHENHQAVAIKNIHKLCLQEFVEFKVRDVATGFDEVEVDAVILDLPEPWNIIEVSRKALAGGGILVIFVPTYGQVDQAIQTMEQHDFMQLEAFEVIRRDLTTKPGAIRPVTRMVGFTGFLVVGRKAVRKNQIEINGEN